MSIYLQIQSHHLPILISPPSLPVVPIPGRSSSPLRCLTKQTSPPPLRSPPEKRQLGIPRFPLQVLLAFTSVALPSLAAETEAVASDKINVEAIVIAIDDFFSRNPFFVAGITFIWLVVIPLTQEYLKKCKAISAVDAFRKLKDVPSCQLLDIRGKKSLAYMESPNLKFLNKSVVRVELVEGQEESFLKEVINSFPDPGNTVVCVLDNFDGESLKVAESLWKNGFKEAYAIKGGIRGKDGWQAVQEEFIPPSMHVTPRKKKYKAPIDDIAEKMNDNNIPESKALSLVDEHDSSKESDNL